LKIASTCSGDPRGRFGGTATPCSTNSSALSLPSLAVRLLFEQRQDIMGKYDTLVVGQVVE
jgi:hypothetical protein